MTFLPMESLLELEKDLDGVECLMIPCKENLDKMLRKEALSSRVDRMLLQNAILIRTDGEDVQCRVKGIEVMGGPREEPSSSSVQGQASEARHWT
jgi:hypothetical protein